VDRHEKGDSSAGKREELQRARKRIDHEAVMEQAGGVLAARDKNPGERENDDCEPQDELAALTPGRDAQHQQNHGTTRKDDFWQRDVEMERAEHLWALMAAAQAARDRPPQGLHGSS